MTFDDDRAKNNPIALVTTGGTIDAEPYDKTPDDITPLDKSLVPAVLKEIADQQGVEEAFVYHAPYALEEDLYGKFWADSKLFLTDAQFEEAKQAYRKPDDGSFVDEQAAADYQALCDNRVRMENFIDRLLDYEEDKILITHGSDALVQNAQTIFDDPLIKASGKTIVMVASMTPLANTYKEGVDAWHKKPDYEAENFEFQDCEGYHNLEEAMEALKGKSKDGPLEPGVHIIANWGSFRASNEELKHTEKEFNTTHPSQRFFYKTGAAWRAKQEMAEKKAALYSDSHKRQG
jgi:hypothetical protein